MPPKKARVRLRQSEVSFPLAYHATVANSLCTTRHFSLILSRIAQVFDRVTVISDNKSRLFASIILVSKEYSITLY